MLIPQPCLSSAADQWLPLRPDLQASAPRPDQLGWPPACPQLEQHGRRLSAPCATSPVSPAAYPAIAAPLPLDHGPARHWPLAPFTTAGLRAAEGSRVGQRHAMHHERPLPRHRPEQGPPPLASATAGPPPERHLATLFVFLPSLPHQMDHAQPATNCSKKCLQGKVLAGQNFQDSSIT